MRLSDILLKMARKEDLSLAEMAELENKANVIDAVDGLVNSWVVPGSSIPHIKNMTAENITIPSGEIRLGEGEPGTDFSGVRIAFPALLYNGEYWNIVGVSADVFQVGIRASDGKLVAGEGNIIIGSHGIDIVEDPDNTSGSISFYDPTIVGTHRMAVTDNAMQLSSLIAGGAIHIGMTLTGGGTPFASFEEDPEASNVSMFNLSGGSSGGKITGDGMIDLCYKYNGHVYIRLAQSITTPTVSDGLHIYYRNNKIVFQYDDGGTTRYKYLDLTGTGVTWTHTTTAP